MEILFIPLLYQFKKMVPYDWFCGPWSRITLIWFHFNNIYFIWTLFQLLKTVLVNNTNTASMLRFNK